MAANNEVGTIYPIEKIGLIAKKYNIPFLCDASQAVGKIPINTHAEFLEIQDDVLAVGGEDNIDIYKIKF